MRFRSKELMITILLVDHATENSRSVRESLAGLRKNNFRLDRVRSYREILKGFRSQSYDACLIDSGFGNGLKLFSQARGIGFTAPILLVTANDAGEVLEAMRNGVADCLLRDELDSSSIERAICSTVEQVRGIALRVERECRYLSLLDNSEAVIYTHDLEGRFTSINSAGERIFGYSQQELLRLHISQLVQPGQRRLVGKMIERTLDAQVQMADTIELVTKEGDNLKVAMRVHPIYNEGKPVEIQGLVTILNGIRPSAAREPQDLFGSAHLKRVDSATKTQFIYSFDSSVSHPFQANT